MKEGQGSALDPLGPRAPDPRSLETEPRSGLQGVGVWGLRPQRVQGRALAFLLLLPSIPHAATVWTVGTDTVTARVSSTDASAAEVASHVDVHAGPDACPPIDQGQDVGRIDTLAPRPGWHDYEIMFSCPHAGVLRLDDHIGFARMPGRVDFAIVQSAGRADSLHLIDAGHQSIAVTADRHAVGTPPPGYARLGWTQTVGAIAAWIFAGTALLCTRGRQGWIALAAGLSAGLTASIALAVTGSTIVPNLADSVTGLLVAVLAGQVAIAASPRWRLAACCAACGVMLVMAVAEAGSGDLPTAWWLTGAAVLAPSLLSLRGPASAWVVFIATVLFALVQGAAFAGTLLDLGLPAGGMAVPLVGRAAGALAALGFIGAVCTSVAALARRGRWMRTAPWWIDVAGAGLAGWGMFWFISRLHA